MHKTVFAEEAVSYLNVREGSVVVDATFGNGGHSRAILERIGATGTLIAIDRDPDAVERMRQMPKPEAAWYPVHENFRDLDRIVRHCGCTAVHAILFDFGLSQFQIDASNRGFSFRRHEVLDMRMDPCTPLTARDIVNTYTERDIADILYRYGEERHARRIARAIVARRDTQPFETSDELADVVMAVTPARFRYGRSHPATKTFQAFRIVVNDELESIRDGLTKAVEILAPGGRCVALSFHSLEDRIVKRIFRETAQTQRARLVTKKPLTVTAQERENNPRARSAKMRVLEKI